MEKPQTRALIWYDTVGRIPIRVGIPEELTAVEAKTALEEFIGFVTELAALPHADKISIGEAYKIANEIARKKTSTPHGS
jgi:hypothetical protein